MSRTIPEKDWKLLRQLRPQLLNRFCGKVLVEAARIANDSKSASHERYLQLYGYTREQDRILASPFDDHRRSNALIKLAIIHSLDLLTDAEFAKFSEETRRMISSFNEPA